MLRAILAFFTVIIAKKSVETEPTVRHSRSILDTTQRLLEKYCKNSTIEASNKPNDLRIGMNSHGDAVPVSCLSKAPQNNQLCHSQKIQWYKYIEALATTKKDQMAVWDSYKADIDLQYAVWKNKFNREYDARVKFISDKENVNKLREQLFLLKLYHLHAFYVENHNYGNCAAQAAHAGMKMFSTSKKLGFNLNIQVMIFDKPVKLNDNGMAISYLSDHTFLLVKSKLKKTKIVHDEKSTMKYLKTVEKEGSTLTVCDPWNRGYLGKYKNSLGLYDSRGKWRSVTVDNLEFSEMLLDTIPRALSKLFLEELAKMDLYFVCPNEMTFKEAMNLNQPNSTRRVGIS